MEWIKYNGRDTLKEGTICRTAEGEFVIVGEINTSIGTNDEFTEDITHYTEGMVGEIENMLKVARRDYWEEYAAQRVSI